MTKTHVERPRNELVLHVMVMGHNNHNKIPDTKVLIEEFVRSFPFRVAYYRHSGRKKKYFPCHLSVKNYGKCLLRNINQKCT
jgi:hypothetical protein